MPGRLRITLLACALAATLVGCGGSDDGTIPSANSDELLRQLDAIQNDVETGNCELAQQHADAFAGAVTELPADVDAEVRQGLSEASTQLLQLVQQPGQCEEVTGATGESGVEPTTTEPTTTEEEEPTTTEEEEPTTTQPDEEPPPEEGGDEGTGSEEGGEGPLEVPSGGSGGRGGTESGGVEPERRGAP